MQYPSQATFTLLNDMFQISAQGQIGRIMPIVLTTSKTQTMLNVVEQEKLNGGMYFAVF